MATQARGLGSAHYTNDDDDEDLLHDAAEAVGLVQTPRAPAATRQQVPLRHIQMPEIPTLKMPEFDPVAASKKVVADFEAAAKAVNDPETVPTAKYVGDKVSEMRAKHERYYDSKSVETSSTMMAVSQSLAYLREVREADKAEEKESARIKEAAKKVHKLPAVWCEQTMEGEGASLGEASIAHIVTTMPKAQWISAFRERFNNQIRIECPAMFNPNTNDTRVDHHKFLARYMKKYGERLLHEYDATCAKSVNEAFSFMMDFCTMLLALMKSDNARSASAVMIRCWNATKVPDNSSLDHEEAARTDAHQWNAVMRLAIDSYKKHTTDANRSHNNIAQLTRSENTTSASFDASVKTYMYLVGREFRVNVATGNFLTSSIMSFRDLDSASVMDIGASQRGLPLVAPWSFPAVLLSNLNTS